MNASATAQVQETATAQTQETVTVIAGMTAIAKSQASATAGPLLTAISGQPVYQDELNNATNANTVAATWDHDNKCVFGNDGYHVKEDTNWHLCEEATNSYQDVTIVVNVDILNGQTGGLLFHVSKNLIGEYSGYLFEINSAGDYKSLFFPRSLLVTLSLL